MWEVMKWGLDVLLGILYYYLKIDGKIIQNF